MHTGHFGVSAAMPAKSNPPAARARRLFARWQQPTLSLAASASRHAGSAEIVPATDLGEAPDGEPHVHGRRHERADGEVGDRKPLADDPRFPLELIIEHGREAREVLFTARDEDGVRLPQDEAIVFERRHLSIRVERDVLGRALIAAGEIDRPELSSAA
jgi:hypothetical protein